MRRIIYLASLCISLLLTNLSYANNTVTIATTQWAPYVQNDPYYKGYVYNIVEAAFRQAGYDVVIKFMPWDKAVAAVRSGKVDAIFPEYFASNDTKHIIHSEPFSGGPIGLYKRKGSDVRIPAMSPDRNLDQFFAKLKNYKIGVVKGYKNVPAFDNNKQLQKVEAASDRENLLKLYNDKVQLVMIDKYTAHHIIDHELGPRYARALTFVEPAISYKSLYLGVSKRLNNSYKILNDFNHGLSEIKTNGILAKILDKDAYYTGRLVA